MPSVAEQARLVREGRLSPVELVEPALRRIEQANRDLGAVVAIDADGALRAAKAMARTVATDGGSHLGPLAGVPLLVKDVDDAVGLRTTHGDPALASSPPAGADSAHVARLRAAGAIVVGKTNVPAYALSADTDNRLFGRTCNPHAPERTPGGSSGGSAAAVAAGMVPLATATDAGGSIRIPASCCGIAGFKPSSGAVPLVDRTGPAGWGPFDTRGVVAASFADVAVALDVVAGPAPGDPDSVALDGSFARSVQMTTSLRGMRVAWSPTLGFAAPDAATLPAMEAGLHTLADLGADVVEVGGPVEADPVAAWYVLAAAGVLRQVRRTGTPDTWDDRFTPDLVAALRYAESLSAEQLLAAQAERATVATALATLWADGFDLLACPVTASPAPRAGEGGNWVRYTYAANMAGVPAASVPVGWADVDGDRVPVGLQLVGPRLADRLVFAAAARLEESVGASRWTPSGR